jgi:mediator of RNA polymerase II transcription subunit 21
MPLAKTDKEKDGLNATANNANDAAVDGNAQGAGLQQDPLEVEPDPPELFQSRLRELASDLVQKEQQIEALISMLPGVGSSSAAQEDRMRTLDAELRAVEVERLEAVKERDRLLERIDQVILGVKRP